ncbi:TetR/AcrR family transcriptional regulator [Serratia quinivorans]|uniref:TetR/AcrR family transcriptional regulator n=1 Tax=Serratia quinivorans TaxID=137545 RepID=UPI00217880A7|nr:TetR/AcrR family transcriptional regulator [Serratia quinivorans]CAI0850662.1 mycofactocin system transcriptional regulator [Serratia quinivorans]CAI0876127.1 mycofactocin system transcriptional regulator [Serratia quinivorans]CAI1150910.1 mycofactocin system transcriptional regulator [Serratia quinivorans]CAI1501699.1 mycofactocin system transcriptional regulator [Serratia quinivorans]CAI2046346.1 mycofactocin system transcriptional regulator [Serratia quinivorans]
MANEMDAEPRSRGRPSAPEGELRAAAVEATLALLLTQGYAATTVDAVAKRAGMAKKTLYRFAENRDALVAQAIASWTDAFAPVFEQDAQRATDLPTLLSQGLQAIARQVLSEQAVGIFRLLQSEFPGREALLAVYQRNGIERGRAIVAQWLQRQQRRGWLCERDYTQISDLLLAMVVAEPLRQMALGLLPPGSAIDTRIAAALALVLPGLLRAPSSGP